MATKELQVIVTARQIARERGQRAALVTVVRTSGSTYRRPGARMLVVEAQAGEVDGIRGTNFLGSISGGCLEDDAREHALRAIREERPALIRYDTTPESDILFGTGAGCQGIVEAFIEPLPFSDASTDPLEPIAGALRERRAGVLATVIAVDPPMASGKRGRFSLVGVSGTFPRGDPDDDQGSRMVRPPCRRRARRRVSRPQRGPQLPAGGWRVRRGFFRVRPSDPCAAHRWRGAGRRAAGAVGQGTWMAGARRRWTARLCDPRTFSRRGRDHSLPARRFRRADRGGNGRGGRHHDAQLSP